MRTPAHPEGMGEPSQRAAGHGSLTFGAFEVEMAIADPALVEFHLPVVDNGGILMGDAFEYAEGGVAALERVRARIEGTV